MIKSLQSLILRASQRGWNPRFRSVTPQGFTITELLLVIVIIVAMTALLVPALNGIKGGQDVTKAAYDIAGVLDQARTYAIANNTYVFVGFQELDATTSGTGIGVVVVAAVASKDGTRGYDISNSSLPNPAWNVNGNRYDNGSNLVAVGRLQRFVNIHLTSSSSAIPNRGGTARPVIGSDSYQMGNTASSPNPGDSCTPFDWPVGKALGTGQYSFKRVVNFDPQGVARIQFVNNQSEIVDYMEIGLQQTHGNIVSTSSNVAAIQVDCMTGSTHIYRP